MPTPVAAAKQCLTREAEPALEEAVEVARRRGHAQTTSLHLVAALLAQPSSSLREACSRTRNNAYSTRIQFKALDLCLGVSLDRLPSASKVEEPPVSNSLMAAVKRSQANQRRQPENLQFYHPHLQKQQQQVSSSSSSSSVSVLKVELQNLILSILDDPVVSRVFGESGFRSCEIKIAILRPVHQLFRYSRYRGPPMFLCNLAGADNDPIRRGFNFAYADFSGEENCRSIGEIMVRADGRRRNPLLVGAGSIEALRSFSDMVQRRRERAVLPVELSGLGVVCIENEVLKFVNGECEERLMKLRFEEIDRMVENCIGPGVVVNFGNLKAISGHDDDASCLDALRFVVWEMAKLLETRGRKVWLIGSASRYETYLKFLNMFPSVEKDLDLQLLPITASRFTNGGSYPRSSLMESFVPFGGCFSTPGEAKTAFGSLDQSPWRLRNDKFDEVNVVPMANHRHQSGLASWGKSTPFAMENSSIIMKARENGPFLNPKGDSSSQMTPIVGFKVLEEDGNSMSKGSNMNSQIFGIENQGLCSPMISSNSSSFRDGLTSPTSIKSPTIDLNLGINNICSTTKDGQEPDFKTLYKALTERIGRQEEALQVISHTIAHHGLRNGNGMNRGDIWLHFVGPDTLAKREIASALAECHGSRENLIHVDMSDRFEVLYRGRNLVDNIADSLCKNPFSVLLLENIDKADNLVQNCLSKAVKTGKFSDSHGRECGAGNAIFITTTRFENGEADTNPGAFEYSEEDVMTLKGLPIQMIIGFDLGDYGTNQSSRIFMNKRKLAGKPEMVKRAHKESPIVHLDRLDLNFPAEEGESWDSSNKWMQDFDGEIDALVKFKHCDFDAIAQRIFKDISECFQKTVLSECSLEIDSRVMIQMVAAAFLSGKRAVEEWVRCVLGGAFEMAQVKYSLNGRSTVKLVAREDNVDQTPSDLLPSRITLY